MSMEVYIVGSGTGVPSLRRGSPGAVIRVGGSTLLLDSGSGTLRKMLEVKIDCNEVDYLLYSHFHPDHTADLVPFLFASNHGTGGRRTRSLTMIGPRGTGDFYERLKDAYGKWIVPQECTFTVTEIEEEVKVFTDFSLQGLPLEHSGRCTGFRITDRDGKSVAYSGDTDYCQNLISLARGVDLLILECSFPDDQKVSGHLTPSLAGRVGREAGCRRLLLTHLYPPCDDCDLTGVVKRQYDGEVIVAEDLMNIAV